MDTREYLVDSAFPILLFFFDHFMFCFAFGLSMTSKLFPFGGSNDREFGFVVQPLGDFCI